MQEQIEIEHRLTSVEKLAGSNRHRLEDVERRQDNLDQIVASVSVLKSEQEHIQSDVKEIKSDVKTLTEKPAKRWDNLLNTIIALIAGGVVGYVLTHIGL